MARTNEQEWEDLSPFRLDQHGIDLVIRESPGCAVTWVAGNGRAMGVWVTHAVIGGEVWVTTTGNRAKTKAWRRDARTSAVFGVPKLGSVTLLGRIDLRDDDAQRRRFLEELFGRLYHPESVRARWMAAMDTAGRWVGPIHAERYITFDERKLGL
jgi:hypothetical protein